MAQTAQSKQNKLNLQMREILGNAYGFVRSREYTKSIANLTYEELLDAAIERIEGTQGRTGIRATLLEQIAKIQNEVKTAVQTVKSKPPNEWVIASQDQELDANQLANPPPEIG